MRIALSSQSIDDAIKELENVNREIDHGLRQAIKTMVEEGAEFGQAQFEEWPVKVTPDVDDDGLGSITVAGDMPLIAEFGAGDATVNPLDLFENNTETPVDKGSYSREHARQYADYGYWYFGGASFTEVKPHLGLYKAKEYVIENGVEIVQEEILL